MMNGPSVSLCPTVTRDHAYALIDWMKDDEVCQYLSDSQNVSNELQQLFDRIQVPDFSFFFNQSGRFYMIQDQTEKPIGFVRLADKKDSCEIVITIGDKKQWGLGLGPKAIRKSMETAFFELRHKKMFAKIHSDNQRAVKAFLNAGFSVEDKEGLFHSFSITMDRYLDIIKASATAPEYIDHAPCSQDNDSETLLISSADLEKLRRYTEYQTYIPEPIEPYVEELKCEIANARVTDPEKIPENVITMNSIATIDINGQEMDISLVYPHDADHDNQKISILSPLGTAIIGNRKGDTIKRNLESEFVSISIRDILYQPESSGDYHL